MKEKRLDFLNKIKLGENDLEIFIKESNSDEIKDLIDWGLCSGYIEGISFKNNTVNIPNPRLTFLGKDFLEEVK